MKILVLNNIENNDAKRIYGESLEIEGASYCFVSNSLVSPISLLESKNPDIVLTSQEWLPYQRLIIAEANHRGIPTLYVMDGILEWSYIWNNKSFIIPYGTVFQPLLSKNIAVIGRNSARIIASMGIHSNKINIIGLPRLDGFSRERVTDVCKRPKILICTANTAYHNNLQKMSVKEALQDLKNVIENQLEIDCLWRISDELAIELGVKANKESLTQVMQRANAIISFPSTVILEGMLLGIPSAIIEYRAVPIYMKSAWEIRSKNHIYNVVHELLNPPSEKTAYQNYCLDEELDYGSAGLKLKVVIKNLLKKNSLNDLIELKQEMNQSTLQYGLLDYRLVHSQLSLFSQSDVPKMQYELDGYKKHLLNINKQILDLAKDIERSAYFKLNKFLPISLPAIKIIKNIVLRLKEITTPPTS